MKSDFNLRINGAIACTCTYEFLYVCTLNALLPLAIVHRADESTYYIVSGPSVTSNNR